MARQRASSQAKPLRPRRQFPVFRVIRSAQGPPVRTLHQTPFNFYPPSCPPWITFPSLHLSQKRMLGLRKSRQSKRRCTRRFTNTSPRMDTCSPVKKRESSQKRRTSGWYVPSIMVSLRVNVLNPRGIQSYECLLRCVSSNVCSRHVEKPTDRTTIKIPPSHEMGRTESYRAP